MPKADIKGLLSALKADRTIWAEAPCGHAYRLSDSDLFYGSDLTPAAKAYAKLLREQVLASEEQIAALKHKLTEGFTKKSVEIKWGKTVEKIAPVLEGFPYQPLDCRAMYDPIDYLAFVGASKGLVSSVDFVDVKTGNSRLSKVQRQIRDAVEDGKVKVQRVTQ